MKEILDSEFEKDELPTSNQNVDFKGIYYPDAISIDEVKESLDKSSSTHQGLDLISGIG